MFESISEEEYKSKIIALSYACPLEQEDPHCPLKDVRKKSFQDKKKWLNSLSALTKKSIYKYHLLCYAKNDKKYSVLN